jgi:hypothetical protein
LNDGSLEITQAPHKNPKPNPPPSKKKKPQRPRRPVEYPNGTRIFDTITISTMESTWGKGWARINKKRSRGQNAKTASKNAEPANQERREMGRWTDGRGLNQST